MTDQTFSILANIRESTFSFYYSNNPNKSYNIGDVFAKLYYKTNPDRSSREEILLKYEPHIKGSLEHLCSIYEWSTDIDTAPKFSISGLLYFANRSKRNKAIDEILNGV